MDDLFEEEKKDAIGEARGTVEKGGEIHSECCECKELVGEGKEVEKDSENEDEELADLPPEIATLVGGGDRVFESEEALQEALEGAGVGDLRVVLVNGRARLVMPSDQHNAFTSGYISNFSWKWGKNRWGCCSGTHKIHLSNGRSRDPDISYWGYPRCSTDPDDGVLEPIDVEKGPIPDVVVQFSWRNKMTYEEDAINDMMNEGLEHDHGSLSTIRPALGYLIKARFSKKRTLDGAIKGSKTQDMEGLDIYRLAHGTTVKDARDPSKPHSEYWRYVAGGPEVFITIKPQDLGITGFWAMVCGEYGIKASDVFQKMEKYQMKRQEAGLAM